MSGSFLILALLLACGVRRPSQVPAEAVWVDGQDRGAFVQVGPRDGDRWRVKVWGRDGSLRADGRFALSGMARTAIEPHEVAAWDGRQIALKDGTLLVPRP
jgi:hypothetical protein